MDRIALRISANDYSRILYMKKRFEESGLKMTYTDIIRFCLYNTYAMLEENPDFYNISPIVLHPVPEGE